MRDRHLPIQLQKSSNVHHQREPQITPVPLAYINWTTALESILNSTALYPSRLAYFKPSNTPHNNSATKALEIPRFLANPPNHVPLLFQSIPPKPAALPLLQAPSVVIFTHPSAGGFHRIQLPTKRPLIWFYLPYAPDNTPLNASAPAEQKRSN
jgi:hypothetical protein